MPEIKIDQIIRSHRRSIGLHITNDARLIIRAPYSASEEYIRKLILRKISWIKSKQDYFNQRQNKIRSKEFIPGEEFLFLGRACPLVISDDLPKAVLLVGDSLMISRVVLGNAKDHIEQWYKSQALAYIEDKVKYFAQAGALKYKSIRVNSATTRWGSCGYQDSLNFTWRLIMAPARVVDYVIIHELMHLRQKNHSRKFWAEVKNIIPDYKEDERWLKENGYLLHV